MTDFDKLVTWWENYIPDLEILASKGGFWDWIKFNRICKQNIGKSADGSAYKNMDSEARFHIREEIRVLWHDLKGEYE